MLFMLTSCFSGQKKRKSRCRGNELGGHFQKHSSAIAQIVQFSGYFVAAPHRSRISYIYVIMAILGSWMLSVTLHVSHESCCFKDRLLILPLEHLKQGLSHLGLSSSPAAVTGWHGQQHAAQNHSPVRPVIWQPRRQMHHTHILSFSYSHVAGELSLMFLVANSVNFHDPVMWPSLRASALGFAEWMSARGT